MMKNLLVELFVEELPPKSLKKLGEAFAGDIFLQLRKLDFLEPDSGRTTFASPRRLAVHITRVRDNCPDVPVRKKLVPVEVAFDSTGQQQQLLLNALKKKMQP